MGRKKRTERFTRMVTEDIASEAGEIFHSRGFENATMDEIAVKAEYAKRTLYQYFPSKEHILLKLVEMGFHKLNDISEEKLRSRPGCSGLDQVMLLGDAWIEFNRRFPAFCWAIHHYENRAGDFNDRRKIAGYEAGEKQFQLLIGALNKGREDGSVRKDLDVPSAILAVWGATIGMLTLINKKKEYLRKVHSVDEKETARLIFDFIAAALRREKP